MLVIGIFPNDMGLVQALLDMENAGIGKDRLLVVPLDASPDGTKPAAYFNPIAGQSGVESGIAVATASAVVFISRGFEMAWGPLVWGMIGAAGGFAAGYFLQRLYAARKRSRLRTERASEMTVLVECEESERQQVLHALWTNKALSVGLRSKES